jgi:hypothetical protein
MKQSSNRQTRVLLKIAAAAALQPGGLLVYRVLSSLVPNFSYSLVHVTKFCNAFGQYYHFLSGIKEESIPACTLAIIMCYVHVGGWNDP